MTIVAVVLIAIGIVVLHMRAARKIDWTAEEIRSLSVRGILTGAFILIGVGVIAAVLLLNALGETATVSEKLDAIRTAGTIVVGTGGAAALLLAARRQRAVELTFEHQLVVARNEAVDAKEQRVIEPFGKSAEQLASHSPAVRIAGLYALERLADINVAQRQTIVNLICAYLRMPFESQGGVAHSRDGVNVAGDLANAQELQVRLTAQRIIATHLSAVSDEQFWSDLDIDLAGAKLFDFRIANGRVRRAAFGGAEFNGSARFFGTEFEADVDFSRAVFDGVADFRQSEFIAETDFTEARFAGDANFSRSRAAGFATFNSALFEGSVSFQKARFAGYVTFDSVKFLAETELKGIAIDGAVSFKDAVFALGVPKELSDSDGAI